MTDQGSLAMLNDPVAQNLLRSTVPVRLAYVWPDGTPRVVPIWFHGTGQEVVLGGPPDAPKVDAIRLEHVTILDFETRFPSAIARRMTA